MHSYSDCLFIFVIVMVESIFKENFNHYLYCWINCHRVLNIILLYGNSGIISTLSLLSFLRVIVLFSSSVFFSFPIFLKFLIPTNKQTLVLLIYFIMFCVSLTYVLILIIPFPYFHFVFFSSFSRFLCWKHNSGILKLSYS